MYILKSKRLQDEICVVGAKLGRRWAKFLHIKFNKY